MNKTSDFSVTYTLNGLKDSLSTLDEMVDVQCSDGNWDYCPYMHGMANGMLFSKSLFDGVDPAYLDAPEKWVQNSSDTSVRLEFDCGETRDTFLAWLLDGGGEDSLGNYCEIKGDSYLRIQNSGNTLNISKG